MKVPDFLLDRRVVRRNVAKGLVTREQAEEAHRNLRDVAENAQVCFEEEALAEEGAPEPSDG